MKSILLIDKSRQSSDLVEKMLQRYDFHVKVAEGGIIAQRLVREMQFDLILMEFLSRPDLMQKADSGVELLGDEFGKSTGLIRELRARRIPYPIIVYTTLKGELYETACLDAGANDYILKSTSATVVLARLNAHIEARERELGETSGRNRRTTIGKFVLDRETRILLSDQCPILLTPKEVSLLERLATNPYRIVPIPELLEYIWEDELGRSHNSLEALVQRLRRKMEKHKLPDPVQTVRGRGKRLSPALRPHLTSLAQETLNHKHKALANE